MPPPLDASNEPTRRCRQCGDRKPLTDFVRDSRSRDGRRARCALCEITNRTEPKRDRRARHKARDTRNRHAKRLGIPATVLESYYDWTLDTIEAAIVVVADGECPECHERPTGLADIHVDIIDPTHPPHWGVNTRVVCATCNRRKGPRSALECAIADAERRAILRHMEQTADRRRAQRTGQATLFDAAPFTGQGRLL